VRISIIAIVGFALIAPSPVVAAPAELLNKTVTVSYTVTIPTRRPDGTPFPGVRNATRTIYISSAGRAFGRVSRTDSARLSETREAAPGERGNTFRWGGARLIGTMPFASGAAQLTITFGSTGQSCEASIAVGREGGRALRWKGVNGSIYEATGPATVSDVRCAIRQGNAFAGG
jgi:hypothetical protein